MTTDLDIEKKLLQVVCICKGINLRKVLKGLQTCHSLADVNRTVGTGSGGCKGQRCGPKICILLEKKKKSRENTANNTTSSLT